MSAAPARQPTHPAPLLLDGVVPVPAETADRYRAAGYWTDQTLGSLVREAAATWPDATALVDAACVEGTRSLTYADLDRAADELAHGFAALGLRRGDRVVVQLPSACVLVEVLVALGRSGIVPVLALPAHRRTEVEYFAAHTGAVALVSAGVEQGFDHAALAREVGEFRRLGAARRGGG